MAKKDNNPNKKIQSSLDLLKKQVEDLYTSTYYTPDSSEEYQTQVSDKLDDAIRKSTQSDSEFQNISNISKLFRKLAKSTSIVAGSKFNNALGKGFTDDISTLFQDSSMVASLMESYTKTRWITELDNEFDLICRYMTKLQAALDIMRDAVLCSDSYTKKFLNIRAKGEIPTSDKNTNIQNNIDTMIKKYRLAELAETWYENASKYGEEFIYCVPYSTALQELLKRKDQTSYYTTESVIELKDLNQYIPKDAKGSANMVVTENGPVIRIKFDSSKILTDIIQNSINIQRAATDSKFKGLSESFVINESANKNDEPRMKAVKLEKSIGDEIKWEDSDKTAAQGLTNVEKKDQSNVALKVSGAVIRSIKHDKIIPIYIDDIMIGAYYIRYNQFEDVDINSSGNFKGYNSITGMFNNVAAGSTNGAYDEDRANKDDSLLRILAREISQRIDKAFINTNTDLKKEIYLILRFNDKYNQNANNLDIVFVPADDLHHLKFKEDPETHRGISDLWDALVPAKQWITLMLTSVLGWSTRGFDRRLYYVKQSLDTNTAQSMLNVIATIKKGNFGVRQMESVNNILNIVGRFNDFVIPQGPNGEAPIIFDTQPGQSFDFPDQLLQNEEESAVNSTGVPLEIVNNSFQSDFAVRYTMTNAKLLRNVLKRQLKLEDFLSVVFTKIYRFEFNENVELEVTLPAPAMLSTTQGAQVIQSVVQYADSIIEIELGDDDDQTKALFKRRLVRKLIPSYLSDEEIQNIKNNVALDKNTSKKEEE